ncbi:MAG TPA: SDR family oxidoreductase [Verrucomicrobiota bacterium]|nr:SDR family oxidoreductase [Verrucomicrobiota bacterium]HNU51386.1 SDR family oxidoreductase [Verrucomicrobiota bacterium]
MKALVTGGAGFIGSHLAELLLRQGLEVVVLDNFSTGQISNLAWRRPGDRIEIVEGDLRDTGLVRRWIRGCDWVFHQAAVASVAGSVDDPVGTHAQNLTGTLELLEAARQTGVRRVLLASSSAIYGDAGAGPVPESAPPHPLSPYALQKYAGERYAQLYHGLCGLETVALRYFNVYGPRQAPDSPYSGVIARFCRQTLRNEPLVIYGDGAQSRDFVFVEDVVRANLAAVLAPAERVAGKVVNVGTGRGRSVLDLVAALGTVSGRSIEPKHAPARPGEVRHSCADTQTARALFEYSAQVSWEDGLRRTLDWYRSSREQE